MQLTHLAHSCLLVDVGGRRILIDPGTFSPGFEGLQGLDAVVVTHQHPDHLDLERLPVLLEANPQVRLLVEPQVHALLEARGILSESMTAGEAVDLGEVGVLPVGEQHAQIHPYLPQIGNVGVVVQQRVADGKAPRLFHPGDAYDGEPGQVDVLALPLSAPWAAVRDTIAFVRRVAPRVAVPVHDATLSAPGRAMYLNHVDTYGGDNTQIRDLQDGQPWEIGRDA